MKKTLLILVLLISVQFTFSQIVSFPDPNFKGALLSSYPRIDINEDGEIQVSEAVAITAINISGGNFTDMAGITAFTNLQDLTINSANPSFTSLVLNNIPTLTSLNISYWSTLQTVDISGLVNLQHFRCDYAYNIQNLNLTSNTALLTLDCSNLHLMGSLDLSANVNLHTVRANYCQALVSINLSGLVNLTTLECNNNNTLSALNVSGLTNLQTLDCSETNALSSLDVSNLTHLENLNCSNSRIDNLNTTGAINIKNLNCSWCRLTGLSLTHLTHLETLNCAAQNNFSAQGIDSLDLTGLTGLTSLNCSRNNLSTLDVAHLTNLTFLNCGYNHIASLNVAPLTQLTSLNCTSNALTTLDVAPLVNLTTLDCSINQLLAVNVTPLIHLTSLATAQNPLGSLNVSGLTDLTYLYCHDNGLSTLDVSTLVNLESLICSSNQLTSINLENLPRLYDFRVDNNFLTELDLSHNNILNNNINTFNVQFSNNPNLVHVNIKNGAAGIGYPILMSNFCPALRYICANDDDIQYVISELHYNDFPGNTTISANVQVNSYCSFEPAGPHNTITGAFTFDVDNNGCGTGDIAMPDVKLLINDGTNSGAAFSNNLGVYNLFTQSGSFVLTPNFENPYFTVSPSTVTVNFADNDNHLGAQDFCISALGIHKDLEVFIIPTSPIRPGFDANFILIYKNKGNQALSGSVGFLYDEAVLDFVSATPTTTGQTSGNLNWDFANLLPFESREIHFILNVNSPMESPAVNNGDTLNFTATILPVADDETPDNNTFNLNQMVVGSYDPNDKTCLEGATITPDMVGNYLNYVIRFQNSGSFAAENVVVKDVLDAAKFDISTFQLTGSSHPNTTRLVGNKVEFIFEHINLPAEIDDEPGSHGYVSFKIKTKNNLVLGNNIQNTADIYFDFNFPIVTNTTSTTVALLNLPGLDDASVSVAPVPVIDALQIKALETITSIELFDIQGQLLLAKKVDFTKTSLDFTGQPKGVYLVKIYTEKGMKVQKVIKE